MNSQKKELILDRQYKASFVIPNVGDERLLRSKKNISDPKEKQRRGKSWWGSSALRADASDRALILRYLYSFEKDLGICDWWGQVKIVDEQTGRIMEGRRYSDGLHQAIEAKENVKIEAATQTYARITLQNYFRMYHKLAGMAGTASTEAQGILEHLQAGCGWDPDEQNALSVRMSRILFTKNQARKIQCGKEDSENW